MRKIYSIVTMHTKSSLEDQLYGCGIRISKNLVITTNTSLKLFYDTFFCSDNQWLYGIFHHFFAYLFSELE